MIRYFSRLIKYSIYDSNLKLALFLIIHILFKNRKNNFFWYIGLGRDFKVSIKIKKYF